MSKKAISLTLEESNLLWLKARARADGKGSLSDAVDRLIAEARAGRLGASAPARSVVGTIDLGEDPQLGDADEHVRKLFAGSLSRGLWVSERRPGDAETRPKRPRTRRG